jgi:hypothetical protein
MKGNANANVTLLAGHYLSMPCIGNGEDVEKEECACHLNLEMKGKGTDVVVIKGRIPLLPLTHEGIDASQVAVVPGRNSVRLYHALPCREHPHA